MVVVDPITGEAKGFIRAVNLRPIIGEKTHCCVYLEGSDSRVRSYEVPVWSGPMYRALKNEYVTISYDLLRVGAMDANQDRCTEAGLGDGEEAEANHRWA